MEPNTQSLAGKSTPSADGCIFVKEYTNRWGQLMRASDYGKQAFVFFPKKSKPRKKN